MLAISEVSCQVITILQYSYKLHMFLAIIIIRAYVSHRKNKVVQNRLYDHMDDLLELDVAIPDVAEVLTEVCL